MKIKFLIDYLGRETAMKQYHKDDVAEISFAQASELIRLGVAAEVEMVEVTSMSDKSPVYVPGAVIPKYKPKAKEYDYDKDP